MTGKNFLNEQVQTGKFNVPSVSSTLKESGAVSFELVTIHEQPEESAEPQSVNFGFEESDIGGLEEEDADKVAFDTRKESGAVTFGLATIHKQPKESAEPRSVNFGFEESDNGSLEEEDADKVAFDARKESGAVTFALATIHEQPKESAVSRSVNLGFQESDNGGLEEGDADKVAFDARKESGAVIFALATIHEQPKESVERRSVNFGFEESDNGGLEEEDADKMAFDARKESGAGFALATIHEQPKESVERRSVNFGFEESDNGGLEEEDADKVAFDARKENGAGFALATIHEQPKESAVSRSVNFGFEESDNGSLEEEDADKVTFDARKESGAVTFALATIHEQPKESAVSRSVNFGFEESDNGSLEEEDADKVAFDARKESGAVTFALAIIHEQPKESAEHRSVNFGFEESDNGGLEEGDADKVAFDTRKESGAVTFALVTIHEQPEESAEPQSVNFGFEESDNGSLEEEDADKVAFDARKESGAVIFAVATIHEQPKESAEPRSVNLGFQESDNGGLEEGDADKVAFDTRKESGAVTFALVTIHEQPKESAVSRSVNFGFEESDNGSLEEEDADKVAFDARKESGAVTFALATIHEQPKESAVSRSVNFGFEESDNGSLEEEDADKVAFDARKESGAVTFALATIHEQPKESAVSRSVNFGFEESDNGSLEEEDADKVAFDARKESGAVTFALATIHEQPKESAEHRSVNFGLEESDNGGIEEGDADEVAFDTRKKLDHHANPRATFDTHF